MNEKVSAVLRRVCREKKTGILVGEASEWKRAVFFRSGSVVSARSSLKQDQLGELLIRHGRISKEQFELASRSIKSGRKLGEILAEMGVINNTEIERFVKIQITDITCSLLIEPPRRLAFSALREVESVVSKPLLVGKLLMEAARRTPDISAYRDKLLQEERCLALSPRPLMSSVELSLALEEKILFSRIDGKRSPAAILPLSPLPEEATVRLLLGLVHAGFVETEDPANRQAEESTNEETKSGGSIASVVPKATERGDRDVESKLRAAIDKSLELAQSQDHWTVLGVAQGASPDGIKQAFHELVRRYHPDRLCRFRDDELEKKASFIVQRAGEALEALSSRAGDSGETPRLSEPTGNRTESATPYTASGNETREAKEFFARAKMAYDQDDYWQAVQFCREAIDRHGDQAKYYYLLGLALSHNPKWLKDAEQNLQIAAKLDPWKVKYLAALGELYLKAGLRTRAKNVFEQANAIDPSFVPPETK